MVDDHKSDIIMLQEAHDDKYVKEFEFNRFKRYSAVKDQRGGTAILIARNESIATLSAMYSDSGNVTLVRCRIKDEYEIIVGSYYASQDDITMANDISYLVEASAEWHETPVVIGMDRNFDPSKLTINKKYQRYAEAFDTMFDDKEYNDLLNPEVGLFTKRPITRPNQHGGSSIDTVLTNQAGLNLGTVSAKIKAEHFTDHLAIHVTINKCKIERGEKQWRLNSTTCYDSDLKKECRKIITSIKPINIKWTTHLDNVMETIRNTAKATQKKLGKNPPRKREAIRKALTEVIQEISVEPKDNAARWQIIEHYKNLGKATHLQEQIAKIPKSWKFSALKTERPTKQFFNRNKSRNRDPISDVKTSYGISNKTEDMQETFRDYYKELYAEKTINGATLDEAIKEMKKRMKLTPAQKARMGNAIDTEEIATAIKNMPADKAPGPDGLTGKLFKLHPNEWAEVLVHVFEEISKTGKGPRCFVDATIILLRKKATPVEGTDPRDWRPISLTNFIYKIFAKVWATRLGTTLAELIGKHQTGFVPGRDIRDNILLIQAIIEDAMEENTNTALLFVDWEKAFDRLSHQAMHKVLKELEFPDCFKNAILAIYRKCRARVNINDNLTAPFQIRSGVKQGCPLSPLLFILVNEILHCSILNDPEIKGYKINKETHVPNSGYADDTVAIVTNEKEAERVMKHIKKFCQATAAKINIQKSSVMLTGRWNKRNYVPKAFENVERIDVHKGERYLGLRVGHKLDRTAEWNRIINGIRWSLKKWGHEKLSLMAKATIVNSLALSKLWFIASIIPIPNEVNNTVTELVRNFTKGKNRRNILPIATLMRPKSLGGIGIHSPQVKSMGLLTKWISRYKNLKDDGPWKNLLQKYIKKEIDINCLHPFLQDKFKPFTPSIFTPIIQAWNKIAGRDHYFQVKDWVTIIRGKNTSAAMKIKRIDKGKVLLKKFERNVIGKHKQITEHRGALLKVDITVDKKQKIREVLLPSTETQEAISSIDTPQQIVTNEWIYHTLLLKGEPAKNAWHVDKLRATPDLISFYFRWANDRVQTRLKNHEGRLESHCPLCYATTSADHAIFECRKTRITTKLKLLFRRNREETIKEIKRALKDEDQNRHFAAKLTILIAKERIATYWTSRLKNTNTLEHYQNKTRFVIGILYDVECQRRKKKIERKITLSTN
jgi:hypothetical protein